VTPAQYRPARIEAADVQTLLRRVRVRPEEGFSRRFPAEMPCRVRLSLRDGRGVSAEAADYPGFRPEGRTWAAAREKFERLGERYMTPALRDRIVGTVGGLERFRVAELTRLLAAVGRSSAAA
jgi:2-methylcitrate dehydratase